MSVTITVLAINNEEMDLLLNWVSFYTRLSSHYWWKISWKITFWWSQGSGNKNKIPFDDQSNVTDFYLWNLLPLDNPKQQNIRILWMNLMEDVWKFSFFEKLRKFLWEMIVLLYRFSKVAGLTCKFEYSVIKCGSFSVIFFYF